MRANAQDVEFSQYLNNPVYLNPAMAGSANGPRFIVNYRNQWPQLNNAFSTYCVSYDQHIDAISGGIGFQILNDQIANGAYNKLSISGCYNYMFKLTDKTAVRAGMQVSVLQDKLDWGKLLFADQFDPNTALPVYSTSEPYPSYTSKTLLDIGAGFLVYSKEIYFGAGFKHINQPDESFYSDIRAPLPVRVLLNLGAEFKTKRNGKTYISPNIMYALQGKFRQIQGYLMLTKGPLMLGLGYRDDIQNSDAVIYYVGIKTGIFKIMYSYDNTLGLLSGETGGSHEVSVSINLSDGNKAEHKRSLKNSINCPPLN
jgi:type IX secretion system PorP/SprF family membrane protein